MLRFCASDNESISIHAPLARRDCKLADFIIRKPISIHAPLARRDNFDSRFLFCSVYFNPRASCEARPAAASGSWTDILFQSTRLLRGATIFHPPLLLLLSISIHAPLARRDLRRIASHCVALVFQSTRLLRGATAVLYRCRPPVRYFNPRASCEARPRPQPQRQMQCDISIHAPLARRDQRKDGRGNRP